MWGYGISDSVSPAAPAERSAAVMACTTIPFCGGQAPISSIPLPALGYSPAAIERHTPDSASLSTSKEYDLAQFAHRSALNTFSHNWLSV
jgi:hypothetical protein